MKRHRWLIGLLLGAIIALGWLGSTQGSKNMTGAPPYNIEDELSAPENPLEWLKNWQRPDGPARVGLQVGHWKNDQLPDELARLRGSSGATAVGLAEWEVNLAIAEATKTLLEREGVVVDILPATVPEQYWADVFVAIHADGSTDTGKSGFKLSPPWRDFSGKAHVLATSVQAAYAEATQLSIDENVTRNMRGYYAFSWWRYRHAVHPKTAAIILETGFLTSPVDREVIVDQPELSAAGLAQGILEYLEAEKL